MTISMRKKTFALWTLSSYVHATSISIQKQTKQSQGIETMDGE